MNEIATQNRIAAFLGLASPAGLPMPWVGRSMDVSYDGVPETAAKLFEVNLHNFDWNRALRDPYYSFQHFMYVELARYRQNPNDPIRRNNLLVAKKWIDEIVKE